MKKNILLSLVIIGVLFGLARAEDSRVVARIGDTEITSEFLDRVIGYYDANKQKAVKENPQFKATLLKRFVQDMVVARIAKEKGLDKLPDVKEQMELVMNDFLAEEYLNKEIFSKITVSEEDARQYYQVHKNEYMKPEMVRARHIQISVEKSATEDRKKIAREKAETILKRIRNGEEFATLAAEFSDDAASKEKGGDLGFFTKGMMNPDFANAAFALSPGEVSDIVITPLGFDIIKVEEKRAQVPEEFEKVKEKVKGMVLNDFRKAKGQEFLRKAMEDAKVQFYPERLMPSKASK